MLLDDLGLIFIHIKARLATQVVEHTFRKVYRDDGERAAKRVEYFAELWKELRGNGAWEQNPFLVATSLPVIKGNIKSCAAATHTEITKF